MQVSIIRDAAIQELQISFEERLQKIFINAELKNTTYQTGLPLNPRTLQIKASLEAKDFLLVSRTPQILKIQIGQTLLEFKNLHSIFLQQLEDIKTKLTLEQQKNNLLQNNFNQFRLDNQIISIQFNQKNTTLENHLNQLKNDFQLAKIEFTQRNSALENHKNQLRADFQLSSIQLTQKCNENKRKIEEQQTLINQLNMKIRAQEDVNKLHKEKENEQKRAADQVEREMAFLRNITNKTNQTNQKLITNLDSFEERIKLAQKNILAIEAKEKELQVRTDKLESKENFKEPRLEAKIKRSTGHKRQISSNSNKKQSLTKVDNLVTKNKRLKIVVNSDHESGDERTNQRTNQIKQKYLKEKQQATVKQVKRSPDLKLLIHSGRSKDSIERKSLSFQKNPFKNFALTVFAQTQIIEPLNGQVEKSVGKTKPKRNFAAIK